MVQRSGTCTKICAEEPRPLFIHCYGHALNLAVGDTVKRHGIKSKEKLVQRMLDIESLSFLSSF